MNPKSKLPEIRNGAFTKAREKLGLSIKDLAGQACLSKHQIEQIENDISNLEENKKIDDELKLNKTKKQN